MVDTVRGIAYQQAQAVVEAIALLDDSDAAAMRVEGVHDVIDLEVLTVAGVTRRAKQIKVRSGEYTSGRASSSPCCAVGPLSPPPMRRSSSS